MPFSLKRVMAKHRGRLFEKWIFDAKSPLLGAAAINDIDGDGNMEVVFGTKKGDLFCLDHEAKPKWTYKISNNEIKPGEELFYNLEQIHAITSAPALVDINHDGKREVIFGTDNGVLHVLSHDGKLLWQKSVGGAIKATPKIEDVNGDGNPEIIVTSTNKKLVVFDVDGKELLSFKTKAEVESTPAVVKVEGQPTLIVFGMNNGELHAIDMRENQKWKFKTHDKITAEPVLVKGKEPLIVVGSWDGAVYALNHGGELVWRFRTMGAIYNKAVIADVNKDDRPEIIVGSCDNNIYAITTTGDKLWSYETDFWVVASPVVVDLDKDGLNEVIAGSFDNNVYVLEGAGSYELDYVPGISGIIHQAGHYADVLSSEPGDRQGKRIWQYKTSGMIVGCALLDEQRDHPHIVVNVKRGSVDTLGHKE